MRASPPPARRMKLGSLSSGSYNRTAGMLVTKVTIHSTPVIRASLRSDISAGRSDAEDTSGEDADMPTPLATQGRTACGAVGGGEPKGGTAGPPRRFPGRGASRPYSPRAARATSTQTALPRGLRAVAEHVSACGVGRLRLVA